MIELEPIGESRTRVRLTSAGYPDTEAGRQLSASSARATASRLERLRQRFVDRPDRLEPRASAAAAQEENDHAAK